jgi:hypothetical protein
MRPVTDRPAAWILGPGQRSCLGCCREGVMTHRTVRMVMTASVATVSLDTPFKSLAAIMAEHGVCDLRTPPAVG